MGCSATGPASGADFPSSSLAKLAKLAKMAKMAKLSLRQTRSPGTVPHWPANFPRVVQKQRSVARTSFSSQKPFGSRSAVLQPLPSRGNRKGWHPPSLKCDSHYRRCPGPRKGLSGVWWKVCLAACSSQRTGKNARIYLANTGLLSRLMTLREWLAGHAATAASRITRNTQ